MTKTTNIALFTFKPIIDIIKLMNIFMKRLRI